MAELPSDLPKGLSLVLAARQGQQHLVDALLSSRVEAKLRKLGFDEGFDGDVDWILIEHTQIHLGWVLDKSYLQIRNTHRL